MKKTCILGLLLIISTVVFAQSYKSAVGLRLGEGVGFSFNQHLYKNNTLEIIARPNFTNQQRFGISAIFKNHHKLFTRATNWYVGGGVHFYGNKSADFAGFKPPAGISGMFGVEATLRKLNFSFDWKPEVHLVGDEKTSFRASAAISVRYVIAKRKRAKLFNRKIFKRKK